MKYLIIGQDHGCSNFIEPVFYCVKESENKDSIIRDVIRELFCNEVPDELDLENNSTETLIAFFKNYNEILEEYGIEIEIFKICQLNPYASVYDGIELRKNINL